MEDHESEQNYLPPKSPEEILAERKASVRKKSLWSVILGSAAILITVGAVLFVLNNPDQFKEYGLESQSVFSILFDNIIFLLGLFFIAAGLWGLYEARRMTLADIIPSREAMEFIAAGAETTPYYSLILVGSIAAVFIVQILSEADSKENAFKAAALVKPLVREGEFWRLFTGTTLHGSLLHIYFNGQALYGFGSAIEQISNRAHLAIVFLLSAIGGSLLSFYMMPDTTSVGASGAIMGLVGYLAIYGSRRRRQLPPGFLRSMLINIGFIAAFGLAAYQMIDNFAHLGGLTVGAVYGFLQVPRDLKTDPRAISAFTDFCGVISIGVYVFFAVLSILLIWEYIKF